MIFCSCMWLRSSKDVHRRQKLLSRLKLLVLYSVVMLHQIACLMKFPQRERSCVWVYASKHVHALMAVMSFLIVCFVAALQCFSILGRRRGAPGNMLCFSPLCRNKIKCKCTSTTIDGSGALFVRACAGSFMCRCFMHRAYSRS